MKNNILDINKIDISKDNLNFNDKKSNFNLNTKKIDILVKNLKIVDTKTSIEDITLKTPNLNFDDIKSKIKLESSNINLNVNSFLLDKEDISYPSYDTSSRQVPGMDDSVDRKSFRDPQLVFTEESRQSEQL